ncbi:MAG: acetyl-CoA carboxylase carboxyl transferase subunit beta, partial [Acidobacteria bacterium]|nr:acetyl-CoA carboxylase carboxyl transferase subunit beta [Acidobacteriota bacterium]
MPDRPAHAREWISLVLDPGWSRLFEPGATRSLPEPPDPLFEPGATASLPEPPDPRFEEILGADPLGFPGYPARLEAARRATGETESVVCAEGAIDGRRAVAVAFEFAFLGGSMGAAAGRRIARAFLRAAERRAPLIAITSTGGARMQEGMLSLAQMPATVAARAVLAEAHLPFIAYLAHPTTGGVFASFASLADLVWSEPGATVGFAGPRVAAAVTGAPLPEGSHTAERALERGMLDAIVAPSDLRGRLTAALGVLATPKRANDPARRPAEPPRTGRTAWEQVALARRPDRPSGQSLIEALIESPVALRRGAPGEDDPTLIVVAGRLGRHHVVAVAQERHAADGRTRVGGFRRARFAVETAARLDLPVVTLVDTPGADPGATSEASGIACEIALTLQALLSAPVPVVSCVIGEGGSGGALALSAGDRLLILENAVFSVIAPEGAAAL